MTPEDVLFLLSVVAVGLVFHLILAECEDVFWQRVIDRLDSQTKDIVNAIRESKQPTQADIDAAGKAGSDERPQ